MSKPAPAEHQPYVPDHVTMPEFTWPAVLVGTILGIIFGASSLYLVLKVGMTVSASIPVAVLSITLFRVFSRVFGFRRATILENNIVQTTGSAGESIAFGVGATMPAVMMLGFEMELSRVMVVSVLGGVLGILMMIPLRRAFIVKQHGTLKYPEGTACADLLIIGETGGSSAKTVFAGFGLAMVFQFLGGGMRIWKETISRPLDWLRGATPSLDVNPALLGVGYIIGPRTASIMVAGGVLAYLVLVPVIRFFGDGLDAPLAPATSLIRLMDPDAIRRNYVLYVGAGAVAAGGIISLMRALPLIVSSIGSGLRDMRGSARAAGEQASRTDRDLPMRLVLFGSLALVLTIWVFLGLDPQAGGGFSMAAIFNYVNLAAAVLIVLFGFLFVTVSSRLTGEIGSSSNPISGMTIATLLLTCLIFLSLGWTSPSHRLVALSVAAVVCIASSNGGTTSQDLKTGYLVGATPKWQQWSIVIGSVSSALVVGVILMVLNHAGTIYSKRELQQPTQPLDMKTLIDTAEREKAPEDDELYYVWHAVEGNPEGIKRPGKYLVNEQGRLCWFVDPGINGVLTHRDDGTEVPKFHPPQAQLFALITHGILDQKLPWILVLLGVAIALVMELCGVASLPFAVGMYLPLSSSTPLFVGGVVRYMVDRAGRRSHAAAASELESEMSPGVLLATGFIAGGTIAGVIIAFLSFSDRINNSLGAWQYRTYELREEKPLDDAYRAAALADLGIDASDDESHGSKAVEQLAAEIGELNAPMIPRYARVPRGAVLKLPRNEEYRVAGDNATLGPIAGDCLGSVDKASSLFDLNKDQLKLPERLPAGAELKLPQGNGLALAAFGLLAVVLLVVGIGRRRAAKAGGGIGD